MLTARAPLPAPVQPRPKVPPIGFLWHEAYGPQPEVDAFRDGLMELGYIEGQNLIVDYRFAQETEEEFSAFATELVNLPVDVLGA